MPGLLPSSPVSICPTACESPPYRWCSGPLGCIHNNLDRRLSSNDPTNFTSFSSIILNSPASLCVHYTNSCIPSPPNFLSVDFETAVSADRVILWAGEVFSSMIQPVCTAGSQGIQREGRIWSWGVRWVACPKSQSQWAPRIHSPDLQLQYWEGSFSSLRGHRMKRKANSQARLQKTTCPFQVLEGRGREEEIPPIKAAHLTCFVYVLIDILNHFSIFSCILIIFFPYSTSS